MFSQIYKVTAFTKCQQMPIKKTSQDFKTKPTKLEKLINLEATSTAKRLKPADYIEYPPLSPEYITVKDLKENLYV